MNYWGPSPAWSIGEAPHPELGGYNPERGGQCQAGNEEREQDSREICSLHRAVPRERVTVIYQAPLTCHSVPGTAAAPSAAPRPLHAEPSTERSAGGVQWDLTLFVPLGISTSQK